MWLPRESGTISRGVADSGSKYVGHTQYGTHHHHQYPSLTSITMSRPVNDDTRPTWASKTNFDALGVESGEDTDEEEVVEVSSSPEMSIFHHPLESTRP